MAITDHQAVLDQYWQGFHNFLSKDSAPYSSEDALPLGCCPSMDGLIQRVNIAGETCVWPLGPMARMQ